MRFMWMTGLAACLAVQGCAPPPGSYYGAPPGYGPQPYAVTPGAVVQQPLSPDGGPGYPDPAYAPPAYPAPAPDYGFGYSPPDIGYAPRRFIPPPRFYGGPPPGGPGPFERERFERGRERERFERERFERQRAERERPRPPPPAQPLQGPARPQDFRQPPGNPAERGPGRRGFSPEQMRQLP